MGLQHATFDSAQPPHLATHLDLRSTVHLQHRLGHITQKVVVTVTVRGAGKLTGNCLDKGILLIGHPPPNRLTSGVALESKDSANHTRLLMSSRTTYNVSWPFSGCKPSIVSTNDEISR